MPSRRLRFVHAANLLLEEPLREVGPIPGTLRATVRDATLTAFQRLIEICLEREVDFLLLTGNTFVANHASPRTYGTLRQGLLRLAESDVLVLAAPGRLDPADAWKCVPSLPENLTLLDSVSQPVQVIRDGRPIAAVQVFETGFASPDRPAADLLRSPDATVEQDGPTSQVEQFETRQLPNQPLSNDTFTIGVLVDWEGADGCQPWQLSLGSSNDGRHRRPAGGEDDQGPNVSERREQDEAKGDEAAAGVSDANDFSWLRSWSGSLPPADQLHLFGDGSSRSATVSNQPERLRRWSEQLGVDYLAVCNDDRHFTVQCETRLAHNPGGTQAWTRHDTGAHGVTLVDVRDDKVEMTFLPTAAVRCESFLLSVDFSQDLTSVVDSLLQQMQTTLNALQHHPGEALWLLDWRLQPTEFQSDGAGEGAEAAAVQQLLTSLLGSEMFEGLLPGEGILQQRASRELSGPEGVVCLHRFTWEPLGPGVPACLATSDDDLLRSFVRLLSAACSDPNGTHRRLRQRLQQVAPWADSLLQATSPSTVRNIELAWACGWQWLREAG